MCSCKRQSLGFLFEITCYLKWHLRSAINAEYFGDVASIRTREIEVELR